MLKQILYTAVAILLYGFIVASHASAESCVGSYDRGDRDQIISEYQKHQEIYNQFLTDLERALAAQSLDLIRVYASVFEARLAALKKLSLRKRYGISKRSQDFLTDQSDPVILGISAPEFLAGTLEQTKENLRNYYDSLQRAKDQLKFCIFTAWDKIALEGTKYDGFCADGYRANSKRTLIKLEAKVQSILAEMAISARAVQLAVYSAGQRKILDSNLQYLLEELQVLANNSMAFQSKQTKNFIKTVVNPVYLGISSTSIYRDGDTVLLSQQRAAKALEEIVSAMHYTKNCFGVSQFNKVVS